VALVAAKPPAAADARPSGPFGHQFKAGAEGEFGHLWLPAWGATTAAGLSGEGVNGGEGGGGEAAAAEAAAAEAAAATAAESSASKLKSADANARKASAGLKRGAIAALEADSLADLVGFVSSDDSEKADRVQAVADVAARHALASGQLAELLAALPTADEKMRAVEACALYLDGKEAAKGGKVTGKDATGAILASFRYAEEKAKVSAMGGGAAPALAATTAAAPPRPALNHHHSPLPPSFPPFCPCHSCHARRSRSCSPKARKSGR
jgi:hypothetical protein